MLPRWLTWSWFTPFWVRKTPTRGGPSRVPPVWCIEGMARCIRLIDTTGIDCKLQYTAREYWTNWKMFSGEKCSIMRLSCRLVMDCSFSKEQFSYTKYLFITFDHWKLLKRTDGSKHVVSSVSLCVLYVLSMFCTIKCKAQLDRLYVSYACMCASLYLSFIFLLINLLIHLWTYETYKTF